MPARCGEPRGPFSPARQKPVRDISVVLCWVEAPAKWSLTGRCSFSSLWLESQSTPRAWKTGWVRPCCDPGRPQHLALLLEPLHLLRLAKVCGPAALRGRSQNPTVAYSFIIIFSLSGNFLICHVIFKN